MSLSELPARVRAHVYLFWFGMVVAGAGVLGFFFSFWQVGSATQAAIDVHTEVPVFAYASILAWVGGLIIMWYSRRTLDAAVRARLEENRAAMIVDLGGALGAPTEADADSAADTDGTPAEAGPEGSRGAFDETAAPAPDGRDA
ncbi:MAG: hypothetical protein JXP72_04835 [Coriobacteriia bacterium]|nr:hypothetical protein [Coriobacteriia bacterium]